MSHPVDELAQACTLRGFTYAIEGPTPAGKQTCTIYEGWPVAIARGEAYTPASAARHALEHLEARTVDA